MAGSEIRLYQIDYPVGPDEKDRKIALARYRAWNRKRGPRVGDFVIIPGVGYERFAHDWSDGLQTTPGGSFYLGNGYASMSGSLNPSIPKKMIHRTMEMRQGHFWFFHHDDHMAHNAVGVQMPCRVYEVVTP
jgi:hypothetical protein